MKVFFDTNVLIAAFATRGLCADLFAHVLLEHDLVLRQFPQFVIPVLSRNLQHPPMRDYRSGRREHSLTATSS